MDSLDQFLSGYLISDTANLSMVQFFLSIGIAYLGGILASLTPCIYPMIPITIGVVGGLGSLGSTGGGPSQTRRPKWREVLPRCLVYVGGMAAVYAFLGVLAGLTGRVFGTLTNTSGWYLVTGIILTLASLVMLDVIPFEPLVWWENAKRKLGFTKKKSTHKSSNQSGSITWLGAFGLGATSGIVAAPCTTPILTGILAYIANTQSIGMGLALMLGFSLGLGTILLLIAISAGAIQVLPKSGRWMNLVKLGSGLILLAFGETLIYLSGKVSQ